MRRSSGRTGPPAAIAHRGGSALEAAAARGWRLVWAGLLALAVLGSAWPAWPAWGQVAGKLAPAAVQADAAARAVPHRPLRANAEPPALPNATEPLRFEGYPGVPPFSVVAREEHLALYPCSNCHKVLPLNPTPRKLEPAPHPADLQHGLGRMWCLTCHSPTNRDQLVSLRGEPIDFDRSDRVCGQCHGRRHLEWHHGAHGKRVAGWTGERAIYACTHCHDPHLPALQPRAPQKPPPVRAGLQRRDGTHAPTAAAKKEGQP